MRSTIIAGIATCLLVACGSGSGQGGGSGSAAGAASAAGVCRLLTAQEVQAAMRTSITSSVTAGGTGWQACTWFSSDTVNQAQVEEVELQVRPADYFDARRHDTGVQGDQPVAIGGLGDDAFSLLPGYVFVKKSARSFSLRVGGQELTSSDQRIQAGRTLATKVLARM